MNKQICLANKKTVLQLEIFNLKEAQWIHALDQQFQLAQMMEE
jgi:hypothetical protein